MADKRYTIDGYGQLEINNCAFRRDGRVEAQCKLDATDFAKIPAENGMLLSIDPVKRTVKLPKTGDALIAINYSAEHLYETNKTGLKNFKLGLNDFLPRLGYLSIGDKFTTNCLAYDESELTDDAGVETAVKAAATTPLYGTISADTGAIKLTKTAPTADVVLKVVKPFTMPDGQFAAQFIVLDPHLIAAGE